MLALALILLLAYLAGSLPTSIVAGRLLRGIDIRDYGSGNAGGTNTFRVLGWKAGLAVSLVDVAKGFVAAAFIARLPVGPLPVETATAQLMAGLAAVLGHVYTVFAGFRGGKGVGTGAGMLLALAPAALLAGALVFGVVVYRTRYVSLGSLLGTAAIPAALAVQRYALGIEVPGALFAASLVLPFLIAFTHRANIRRLREGTENRVGGAQAPAASGSPESR